MSPSRGIVYLDPNDLIPDPNVRRQEGDIRGLAATIREFGVLEPLGVRKVGNTYRLVYGNRRRAAALLVGLADVPCVILEDRAEDDYVIHQLVENLQRKDLGDLEQAEGLATIRRRLAHRDPKLTEAELDERTGRLVGLSARTVQRYLSLRELPAEVRDLIQDEELTVSQAQHLRLIPTANRQVDLAKLAVEYDLSAAAIRDAAMEMGNHRTLTALEAVSLAGRVQPLPLADEDDEELALEPVADVAGSDAGQPAPTRLRIPRGLGTFDDELGKLLRSVAEGHLDRAIRRNPRRLDSTIAQVRKLLQALEEKAGERPGRRKGAA